MSNKSYSSHQEQCKCPIHDQQCLEFLLYLQALGIRSWYAREPLPGALESEELTPEQLGIEPVASSVSTVAAESVEALQVESKNVNEAGNLQAPAEPQVTPVQPEVAPQPEPIEASQTAAEVEKPPVQMQPQQAPIEEVAKPVAKPITFACQLLFIPEKLFVIASLPAADAPGFSASQHQLMQDVLLALECSQFSPQESLFSWPLVKGGKLPQGSDVARKALHALIRSKKLPDSAMVLLMGKEAIELGANAELNYEAFVAEVANSPERFNKDEASILLPSLEDMLTNPNLKKVAWTQLQFNLARNSEHN